MHILSVFMLLCRTHTHTHTYKMCAQMEPNQASAQTNMSATKACHEYDWRVTHKTPTLETLAHMRLLRSSEKPVKHACTRSKSHFYTRLHTIRRCHYGKAPSPMLTWGDPMTQSICVSPQLLVTDRPAERNLLWQIKISAWQAQGRRETDRQRERESTLSGHHNN